MRIARALLSPLLLMLVPAIIAQDLARDRPVGNLTVVHRFERAMPTGVAVSKSGRIFVDFPRGDGDVPATVVELKVQDEIPFPSVEWNKQAGPLASRFVSVQSVTVDEQDRLWALDTGTADDPPVPGGPKLVGIDLKTNKVFKTYFFNSDVALSTSYLNDVRFDLRRGKSGYAFITDSSGAGTNAIIVLDLATGEAWRRLANHPSVHADPGFVPLVEGEVVMRRPEGKPARPFAVGVDGVAISPDRETLFYCPLSSRRLYSVSVAALVDRTKSDDEVARTIVDLGEKGAADGLETDAHGNLFITNFETNSLLQRASDGTLQTIVHDPRLLWPDSIALGGDGSLYVTANQLHRAPWMQSGRDRRERPFLLFKVQLDKSVPVP